MNMYAIMTLVMALCTLISSLRVIQLQRSDERQRKMVRRLERTIEKLNSRNGKLWYQLARSQNEVFDERREQTGLTITKV